MGTTARLGLPTYVDSEVAAFGSQVGAITTVLDAKVPIFLEGKESERPEAGTTGRFFTVKGDTEAKDGLVFYDDGVAWVCLNPKAAQSSFVNVWYATRAEGAEIAPSASRPVHVTVTVLAPVLPLEEGLIFVVAEVLEGGEWKTAARVIVSGNDSESGTCSFIVPAGGKWRWRRETGAGHTKPEVVKATETGM